VIEHPVVSASAIKKWANEHLLVDPPEEAIFRLQEQLTFMAQSYLSREVKPDIEEMFSRPTNTTVSSIMGMSEKARRIYKSSTSLNNEKFQFGKVMEYDRAEAESTITFLWTKESVNLKRAKPSKIMGPICAKTMEWLHNFIFVKGSDPILVSISDLKSMVRRDKRHQREMWIGFDGKNFYRVREEVIAGPVMPMDGASELVSFFQSDKEALCVLFGGCLVFVGPQRTAVVSTFPRGKDA